MLRARRNTRFLSAALLGAAFLALSIICMTLGAVSPTQCDESEIPSTAPADFASKGICKLRVYFLSRDLNKVSGFRKEWDSHVKDQAAELLRKALTDKGYEVDMKVLKHKVVFDTRNTELSLRLVRRFAGNDKLPADIQAVLYVYGQESLDQRRIVVTDVPVSPNNTLIVVSKDPKSPDLGPIVTKRFEATTSADLILPKGPSSADYGDVNMCYGLYDTTGKTAILGNSMCRGDMPLKVDVKETDSACAIVLGVDRLEGWKNALGHFFDNLPPGPNAPKQDPPADAPKANAPAPAAQPADQ